jgi:hypothetical protein
VIPRGYRLPAALLAATLLILTPHRGDARAGGMGGGGHGGFAGGTHGGWGHGGWGGSHAGWWGHRVFVGPRFIVGGFLFGSPLYPWPYYWGYPYGSYPYPYGAYGYFPPYDENVPDYPPPSAQTLPPDQSGIPPTSDVTPPPDQGYVADQAEAAGDDYSSYGLIQLRGVPDGATVDLDGRRWLDGRNLASRWLALPAGLHTIAVRADGYETFEQRIDVAAGRNQVVRIGPLRLRSG